jgi:hypothetical protein
MRFLRLNILALVAVIVALTSIRSHAKKWFKSSVSSWKIDRQFFKSLDIRAGATAAKTKSTKKVSSKKKSKKQKEEEVVVESEDESTASMEVEATSSTSETVSEESQSTSTEVKLKPVRLLVGESSLTEEQTAIDSKVFMSAADMNEAGLFEGDFVLLKGKRAKTTVANAFVSEEIDDSTVLTTKVIRSNIR